jgi:hypothetical protein
LTMVVMTERSKSSSITQAPLSSFHVDARRSTQETDPSHYESIKRPDQSPQLSYTLTQRRFSFESLLVDDNSNPPLTTGVLPMDFVPARIGWSH